MGSKITRDPSTWNEPFGTDWNVGPYRIRIVSTSTEPGSTSSENWKRIRAFRGSASTPVGNDGWSAPST